MTTLALLLVLATQPGLSTAEHPDALREPATANQAAAELAARKKRKLPVYSDANPPPGPADPAPWVRTPFIQAFQVVAGLGARGMLLPLALLPGLGPWVAVGAMPVLEAVAVTLAGDRLGNSRGPLLLVTAAAGLVGGTGAVLFHLGALSNAALALAVLAWVSPAGAMVTAALPDPLRSGPLSTVVMLAGMAVALGAMGVLGGVQGAGALLMALSPLTTTVAYRALKRRKAPTDNGTGRPALLPGVGPWPDTPTPEQKRAP